MGALELADETPKNGPDWKSLLSNNVLDGAVALYCAVFFVITYKFNNVMGSARRLQRLNLFLIAMTASGIISRNIALELKHHIAPLWIRHGINSGIVMICSSDITILVANTIRVLRISSKSPKMPKEHWKLALLVATLLSLAVIILTFELYPGINYVEFGMVNGKSYIYMVFAFLVWAASQSCFLFFASVEKKLVKNWPTSEVYLHIRHEFLSVRALVLQAGFNSAFNLLAVMALIYWRFDQHIFHSKVLCIITAVTTASFFSHQNARAHVCYYFGLNRFEFFKKPCFSYDFETHYQKSTKIQHFSALRKDWREDAARPLTTVIEQLDVNGLHATTTPRLQKKTLLTTIKNLGTKCSDYFHCMTTLFCCPTNILRKLMLYQAGNKVHAETHQELYCIRVNPDRDHDHDVVLAV